LEAPVHITIRQLTDVCCVTVPNLSRN